MARGEFMIEDLGNGSGTWVNGRLLAAKEALRLQPGDTVQFGANGQAAKETYRVSTGGIGTKS